MADIGGTKGSFTAKCGTTIYGPSGQQRTINIFFPDANIEAIFGAGITKDDLAAYMNSSENGSASVTTDVTNFGTTGTLATVTYTFASPKDVSVGVSGSAVGGIDNSSGSPSPGLFALHPNYPNPFNPSTVIAYSLPVGSHVTMTVYNVLGQKAKVLVDENKPAGGHTAVWDGTDLKGNDVASGIYFYKLETGDLAETRKMILLR